MHGTSLIVPRVATLALACASAFLACTRPAPAPAATVPAPAEAPAAPAPCAVATDCGPGFTCRFDTPGCNPAVRGTCVAPEPPCTVAHPFCACDGKTVHACSHPARPYRRAGPCEGPSP